MSSDELERLIASAAVVVFHSPVTDLFGLDDRLVRPVDIGER
ncbi:MAG TPA: hypothetical protein VKA32_09410 [Gammaproteobacteria bacterium]|nr:hypothetical protein [Gammaproteobacteria bacterium]